MADFRLLFFFFSQLHTSCSVHLFVDYSLLQYLPNRIRSMSRQVRISGILAIRRIHHSLITAIHHKLEFCLLLRLRKCHLAVIRVHLTTTPEAKENNNTQPVLCLRQSLIPDRSTCLDATCNLPFIIIYHRTQHDKTQLLCCRYCPDLLSTLSSSSADNVHIVEYLPEILLRLFHPLKSIRFTSYLSGLSAVHPASARGPSMVDQGKTLTSTMVTFFFYFFAWCCCWVVAAAINCR